MIRKRLITVLTFNEGVLFRTKTFKPDYRYTHNFIDSWSVDEIVVLNISRSGKANQKKFFKVVSDFAANCFVPLSVGGAIRSIHDVKLFLDAGADKVIINTGAIENPDLINEIAIKYGKQCVIVSIDVNINEKGIYEVFDSFGERNTGYNVLEWVKKAVKLGAGELMINSIDRDGSLLGYDIKLCKLVSSNVNVPVLICGGAGNWKHFEEGFNLGGASAVCTSNIYHFTESSINNAKNYLDKKGLNIRR